MPPTLIERAPAKTQFAKNLGTLTLNSVEYGKIITTARLRAEMDIKKVRAAMDFDTSVSNGSSGLELQLEHVVEGAMPLLALALADNVVIPGVFRSSLSGEQYSGNWCITAGSFKVSDAAQMANVTAVNQGGVSTTVLPAALTQLDPRTTGGNTKFAKHVISVVIGNYDFVQVFNDLSVDIAISVSEGRAALDNVRYPNPQGREITFNMSKIVEAEATATASLHLMEAARNRAKVAMSLQTASAGNIFSGSCWVAEAAIEKTDGADKETCQLVFDGACAIA